MRVRRVRRGIAALTAAVLSLVTLSGCSSLGEFGGIYDLPLPGGADLGDHPYRVKVRFRDVLDLVPQAAVKVNDVTVGRVEKIELAPDGWSAEVTVAVHGDVRLPANAEARLRQSSLLGEKFVELAPPQREPAVGELTDGALIPVERTNRNPEVEEVLGALAMVLNGGGIAQVQNIAQELNAALEGNEPEIRALLDDLDQLVGTLDGHKGEITRALDGINRLSATLSAQREQIANALDGLGPGLEVLTQQREQLVTMLESLDQLSAVATDVVNRSRDDLVADLRALTPTLTKLAEAGDNLPRSFELLLTYPFPDEAADGVKGDYTNLYITLDLDLARILDNLSRSRQPLLTLPGLSGDSLPVPLQPSLPATGSSQSSGGGADQQNPNRSGGLGDLLGPILGGGR